MTKSESVIRSILGAVRVDIRPLAFAVDTAVDLMFVQGIPMDDIFVTDDINSKSRCQTNRAPVKPVLGHDCFQRIGHGLYRSTNQRHSSAKRYYFLSGVLCLL